MTAQPFGEELTDWRLVKVADAQVSLMSVAADLGVEVPRHAERSVKVFCPFGELYHKDGGSEPALRLYPETNTGWCFACSAFYTPTRLYSQAKDVDLTTSARELLAAIGWVDTRADGDELERTWAYLTGYVEPVDPSALAESLKVFCEARAQAAGLSWRNLFLNDMGVGTALNTCLDLVQHAATSRNDELLRRWRDQTKSLMGELIDRAAKERTGVTGY